MKRTARCRLAAVPLACCLLAVPAGGQAPMPRMTTATPDTAKIGEVVTVEGENLEKANVAKLYLTDGRNDYEVRMDEQTAKAIKFTVPKTAKPGRLALMILTTGNEPKLIEQPVKVNVQAATGC